MKAKRIAAAGDRPLAVFTDMGELDPAPGIEVLGAGGFRTAVSAGPDADQVAEAAREAVALVAGYARIDSALLERLPALRIVATMSAGYDNVDTAAAAERGIWVCNLPDGATEEVAVYSLTLALLMVRSIPQALATVRSGGWAEDLAQLGRRPSTLTMGVVGLGRIGAKLAGLAKPIFGEVLGYDPYLPPGSEPAGVAVTGLEELVGRADVVSLHLPLTPGTEALVGNSLLERFKRGSFLVNTSRGGLVDEAALLAALESGALGGAALDVFGAEPLPPGSPLRSHPRILATPHVAYLSEESMRDYVVKPARNLVAWLQEGRPLTPVAGPA